ncbi:glycosyl hydrolase 108 family protein [Acidisoma sp. 7E03]
MASDQFNQIVPITLNIEGGLSLDRNDRMNWTGGQIGVGKLVGTKYGISAGAFPTLDIANLTLDQAKQIYRTLYYDKVNGDALPIQLAALVFDAAVNNGVAAAIKLLQASVGATADGLYGTQTAAAISAALAKSGVDAISIEFQARRLLLMAALPTWPTYGGGWARRLCSLPISAVRLVLSAAGSPSNDNAGAAKAAA